MADFIIKKLPYNLTSNAGLALVGQYINRLGVSARVDRKFPIGVGGNLRRALPVLEHILCEIPPPAKDSQSEEFVRNIVPESVTNPIKCS